jgi:hypothetical protein
MAMEAGRRIAAGAAYEVKTLAARSPRLSVLASRMRGRGVLVHPSTDILIEGYPRSANAFAVAAFRQAQGRPVEVAHHTHAPGHVLAAIRMGVPSLVLIREPEEAVLEFAIVRPNLGLRLALRGWVRFYEALLPHRPRFVVGSFPAVTSDYGAVISRMNDLFGSAFKEFDHSEENVRELFRHMDDYWHDRLGPESSIEPYVGRPSDERDRVKDELRGPYRAQIPAGMRAGAVALYRAFARERT